MASPDRFDGLEVDQHQARFSGTVELDPTDADRMSIDTQFMAVVVCTIGGATVADNAKGELIRTNKFKLDGFAVVRDGDMQEALYKALPALVGGTPEPPTDPQLFDEDAPKADANGERIVIEGTLNDDGVVEVSAEDFETIKNFDAPEAEVEDDDDDEEVFAPGSDNRVMSHAGSVSDSDLKPGRPAPATQARQYDPALSAFLRE